MSAASDDRERQAIAGFLSERTEERFCALFDAFYGRLCRYFEARTVDRACAEELAENVMFQVYRHVSQLRDGASFHGWIFQIARNEFLQHRRKSAAALPTVEYEPLARRLADTLESGARVDGGGPFRDWMSKMDETEREILILRFVEDLDYPEISEALGIPVGTIKWKVFNAKRKLAAVTGRKAANTP
jgi:RNA polymerase sigma-70 factor (ECF subfamily)